MIQVKNSTEGSRKKCVKIITGVFHNIYTYFTDSVMQFEESVKIFLINHSLDSWDQEMCFNCKYNLKLNAVIEFIFIYAAHILFHAWDSHTHEAALFQNIFKFCYTILPKFSNILPFLPFFWEIACMSFLSRIGPDMYMNFIYSFSEKKVAKNITVSLIM